MAKRLSSGLAGLDAQLGGGVPPGTVHIALSEPMNAQELLAYHFAAAASQEKGCVFFASEASEPEVKKGVENVGGRPDRVHVARLPFQGRWSIPDARPGFRYVVDSFSKILLNAGWKDAYAQLNKIKSQMRKNGDTLFLLITEPLHSDMEITMLKQWADGVMQLGFDRQGFGLYPYMKITKMRGVPDSSRFLLFRETDRGLFMESTRRVF